MADEQPQAAAAESKPANTQTPRDCFVGTPENNLRPQAATAATEPAQPAGELKRSTSFMERSSGSSNEGSTVLLTSCTGVNAYNMENKRNRTSDQPRKLSFELIKLMTNNFSEELGRGAFGQVFKGVLEDGQKVAVKMLHFMPNINDQQFENEFQILKRLKHPNIVRLVGFCDEVKEELIEYNGKLIVCQRIHRALCLEYMPNGSLGKLLTGEGLGKNWPIRYKVIKGICQGLRYLQEGLEFPIFHFDLKPDNILLNRIMMPKISDFGISRLIGEENTKTTLTPLGTIGYLPPEFINYQVISKEYDIYSLGVIITKIITGTTGYSDVADMGAQEFVEHVHENWKKCLQEIPWYESLEVDCKQVKTCIEIARRCMENDRHKRPMIKDIVSQLGEIDKENFELHPPPPPPPPRMVLPIPSKYDIEFQSDPTEQKCGNLHEDGPSEISHPAHPDFSALDSVSPASGHSVLESYFNYRIKRPSEIIPKQAQGGLSMNELKLGSLHKDPPSEICHPAHPEHKLKLMTDAGTLFWCDGCKQPGYGPRYACDCGGGDQSLDLHTRCALADDPLFDLHTLVHPLFGYGKQFEFLFLHEPPPSVEGRRVCDACGEATLGFVYHCSEQGLDLHPCCASLPDRIIQDGRAFDLHRRASGPCALCPENEGQRRWFWAYRWYADDDEVDIDLHLYSQRKEDIDLHVACLKETARHSWEEGALNVDGIGMLENQFGEIAGTVASFITALVFGNLIVKM